MDLTNTHIFRITYMLLSLEISFFLHDFILEIHFNRLKIYNSCEQLISTLMLEFFYFECIEFIYIYIYIYIILWINAKVLSVHEYYKAIYVWLVVLCDSFQDNWNSLKLLSTFMSLVGLKWLPSTMPTNSLVYIWKKFHSYFSKTLCLISFHIQ